MIIFQYAYVTFVSLWGLGSSVADIGIQCPYI